MSNNFMNYHMVSVLNEKMMRGIVMDIYFAVFSSERSFPTFLDSHFPSIMCNIWESLRGTWSANKESGNRGKNRELLWSNSPQGNVYQCSCHPYCIALWLCIRPSNIGSPHLTYITELIRSSHTDACNFFFIFAQPHHDWEEDPEMFFYAHLEYLPPGLVVIICTCGSEVHKCSVTGVHLPMFCFLNINFN